jgi:hypothetical protein
MNKFAECLLTAFPTMGDPLEFQARHKMGALFPTSTKALENVEERISDYSGMRIDTTVLGNFEDASFGGS